MPIGVNLSSLAYPKNRPQAVSLGLMLQSPPLWAKKIQPTQVGFVQLAAPLEGDGGLLGKRGVESEDKTLQPKGFRVKLIPMGIAMPS
ncbi:hypothetical protein H6G33_24105 [Calothrix sp. FACHB-1219]|uniref:hypothetical protein n=1 Tax=unclassified Calothrix TaxID=2619626 RepID=UPI00168413B2|nr:MULTISPECIES: hypothetical protein [unclassified Calothrix]MBD2205320.1 hypothetical protein [Calothrix sp. FACHB-168]MBD2220092.1 hypothetical protein [Calothrix sp. FACHB-1219]